MRKTLLVTLILHTILVCVFALVEDLTTAIRFMRKQESSGVVLLVPAVVNPVIAVTALVIGIRAVLKENSFALGACVILTIVGTIRLAMFAFFRFTGDTQNKDEPLWAIIVRPAAACADCLRF